MTRIAIIGAGAIGSALGALLCRAGQDVTLIGRADHIQAIQRNGLRVDGALGDFTVAIAGAETLTFRPDLAFLTVKTQDVLATVQANRSWLSNIPVVTFQNGIRSDALAASVLPPGQLVSAVVNLSATYLEAGCVTVIYPGALVVGRPFSLPDAQLDVLAAILRLAVPTTLSYNIYGAHWLKLIANLNNAFPALTNLTIQQIYAHAYLRRLAVRTMREGLRAVRRAGIRLASIPDAPAILFRLLGWLPLPLAARLMAARARRLPGQWPLLGSTLQSLRRGRPTEIDYLNGEVVRLGQQLGLPTPLNATLLELVHQVEQTGRFWTAETLQSAIQARAASLRTASQQLK